MIGGARSRTGPRTNGEWASAIRYFSGKGRASPVHGTTIIYAVFLAALVAVTIVAVFQALA